MAERPQSFDEALPQGALEKFKLTFDSLLKTMQTAAKLRLKAIPTGDPKSLSDVENFRKQKRAVDDLTKAQDRLVKAKTDGAKITEIIKERTRAQNAANKEAAKLHDAESTSIKAKQIRLKQLRKAYDVLTAAERKNLNVGGKLVNRIEKLDTELRQLNSTVRKGSRMMEGFKSVLQTVAGGFGLIALFQGIGRAIGDSFRRIREFDKEMQNMAGIAGTTRKELIDVEKTIIRVAGSSIKTSNEVAKLATSLFTLGKTKEEVMLMLKPVNDLSIALGTTSEEAANFLGQTLNAFGRGAESAQEFADIIANVRSSTSLDFQKIKDALGFVAPTAKALGLSLGEVSAQIGILQDNGIKAARAGRLLNSSFARLVKQGVSLDEALVQINESQDKVKTSTELFGTEAFTLGVILADNVEKTAKLANEFDNLSEGSLKKLTDEQLKSLDAQFKILDSTWEKFILDFDNGTGVISRGVRFVVSSITSLIASFRSLNDLREESASNELTEALKNDRKEIDELAKSLEKNGTPALEAQRKAVRFLLKDLQKLREGMQDSKESTEEFDSSVASNTDNLRKGVKAIDAQGKSLESLKKTIDETRSEDVIKKQTEAQIEALLSMLDAIDEAEKKAAEEKKKQLTKAEIAAEKRRLALLQKAIDARDNEFEAEDKLFEKSLKAAGLFGRKKEDLTELENAALESLELTHQENITAIIKKFTDEQTKFEVAASDAAIDADNAAFDSFEKNRKKGAAATKKRLADEEKAALKKIRNAEKHEEEIFNAFEDRIERERQINERNLDDIDRQLQFQQELALKGETNTLDALSKKRAEAQAEQQELDRKAARQKEAQQLTEIFFEFMKIHAKDGLAAAGKATAQTIAAKAIGKLIAGNFAEGVENFKGEGTGTSDSNIIGFSKGESVLTAAGTKETPGLATAVNDKGFLGAQQWAMKNVVPTIQDRSKSDMLSEALGKMLNNKLDTMNKTLKDLPDVDFKRNVYDELVRIEKQKGLTTEITTKIANVNYKKD